MRRTLFLLSLLCLSQAQALTYQQIRQSGVLRIGGTLENYPPFTTTVNGRVQAGWEYELANAVAAEMGLRPQWTAVAFDDIINRLRAGDFDMVAASLNATPERQKVIDFTAPIYCSGFMLISPTGGVKTVKDLAGKRLSVRRNTVQADYARGLKGLAAVGGFRSDLEAFNNVLYGRYDSVLVDSIVGLGFYKDYSKYLQLSDVFDVGMVNWAVNKDQAILKQEINAALQRVRANGTYARITAKYFPKTIDCPATN